VPFWISLALLPLAWIAPRQGGWTVLLLPVVTWYLFAASTGAGAEPKTPIRRRMTICSGIARSR
jgi:alkane 1-monooxygenase